MKFVSFFMSRTVVLNVVSSSHKSGPKQDPIRHPQIQAFPTKNGIRLTEWSHHYDRNDLKMYLELEIIPEEELTRAQERESKSELHKDLLKLLDDAPFSDLTIVVGEGDKKKSFKAHKSILATRLEFYGHASPRYGTRAMSFSDHQLVEKVFLIFLG